MFKVRGQVLPMKPSSNATSNPNTTGFDFDAGAFVKLDSSLTDQEVILHADAGTDKTPIFGVVCSSTNGGFLKTEKVLDIQTDGVATVTLSASSTIGAELTSAANGKARLAVSGEPVGGILLKSGAANDKVPVKLVCYIKA